MTLSARIARALALLALSLSVLLAGPLAAQDVDEEGAGEGAGGDIVVTGSNRPVSVVAVQRQARAIAVRAGDMLDVPLARFEDRLCPGVAGLTPDVAALFNARLRTNAAALGLRLLDDDCDPNFVTVFTQDGGALLERLMRENPQDFEYLDSGEQHDILAPGPVHVWTSVTPRTLTGMPIEQVRNLANPPRMGVWGAHTRIYTTTRNDITSVMLTFDVAAVRQLSVVQLADYATMRGLAQTRAPEGDVAMDTILTLFIADSPPPGLTAFDRAYLRSLYDGLPNLPGNRRLAGTARQLRLMAEEEAGEDMAAGD
ncbi:MAG: hypothetical protein KDE15_11725 [Erythrobacter sp.]|nr:hypothetical protein [Erythrobacter sp.]